MGLSFIFGLYYYLNIQNPPTTFSTKLGELTKAPKSLRLDLDQPDDDLLSLDESIIVSGKTSPNAEVLISSNFDDFVIKSNSDGNFSTILHLDEGVNLITLAVFDQNGDSRTKARTVYYSKEKI